ncbi:MAG: ATP-dependent DNA/RNA helicase [Alyxoria varia]|nr:MAG: ATP-dependent DNA/RNA helicase [Alyxoria varia]
MAKRKLNEHGLPEPVTNETTSKKISSFTDFGLDHRLVQATAKERYANPTLVQTKAIPLVLQGKDVLARAKTGSGKTAAYVLPILHRVLRRKNDSNKLHATSALVLVPTKELASQVTKAIASLTAFCPKQVETVNLTQQTHDQALRAHLQSAPDVVVSTPARALQFLIESAFSINKITNLVIDEADLVLSYGYEDDLKSLVKLIPQGVQVLLASATLTTEVHTLKGLFCRDPVVLNLQHEEACSNTLSQYIVHCAEDEKFLLLFAVFKLKLIHGKCIVFVGDIDRCYRVKLFLEQFGIKSCVLNAELPVNCRIHIVEEFNKDVYDIIIATDELEVMGDETNKSNNVHQVGRDTTSQGAQDSKTNEDAVEGKKPGEQDEQKSKKQKTGRKGSKKDREFGISRGIDFKNVACVLNFDLPPSAKSYTHRIGRTARAGRSGIALSFVIPHSLFRKHKPTSFHGTENDEEVEAAISAEQGKRGQRIEPYGFDMEKLNGFKYRVSSALKVVSPGAIRQARVSELRQELLKSEKLKRHLEENPDDAKYLRHDTETRAARSQPHLKHVPDYLMPNGKSGKASWGATGFGRLSENRIRKTGDGSKVKGKRQKTSRGSKSGPLKTFNAEGRG